jgi:hypothetical protein
LAAILPTIYIIRRKLSLTFSWYVISKSVVIFILCALLLIILNSFNVVIQLLISSSFYLIMIYFFKLVPHEDIQLVLDRAKVR